MAQVIAEAVRDWIKAVWGKDCLQSNLGHPGRTGMGEASTGEMRDELADGESSIPCVSPNHH